MRQMRLLGLTGLLIIVAIVIAACESEEAETVPTPVFEPTAAPAGTLPVAGDLPSDTPAPTAEPAAPTGDAANGEAVFNASGCAGCHSTGTDPKTGPGLGGVGTAAESRVAGQSASEYLATAIVAPNEFVVEGFAPIMPGSFADSLSDREVTDLVAYLLALD